MRVEQSVIVGRSVDDVFALVGNPDNDTQWGSLIVESQQISPGPVGKGTVFQQTATFLGGRLKTTVEITEFEPGKRVSYRATEPVALEHVRTFEAMPEGTRLTFVTDINPGGALRVPGMLLQRMASRQMEADLDGIKTLMEAPGGRSR